MNIQRLKNGKGLIYGHDPKRIECDIKGVLKIGSAEINISGEEIMPVLVNGSSGERKATFTSELGHIYDLGKVTIKAGRLVSPSQATIEKVEMQCRIDLLEDRCKAMEEKLLELSNIFDTNSLNFLI